MQMAFLDEFLRSFVLLFIIMNPFASLPLFLSLTRGLPGKQRTESANSAVLVAGLLLFVFLFFGQAILGFLSLSFSSFQIAGGIVLMLLALEIVLGIKIIDRHAKRAHAAIVIIGTPLLTGPGVMTTVIILSAEYGWGVVAAAGTAALLAAWLTLAYSRQLQQKLGESSVEAASKIIGLLLAATAVELIRKGLAGS